VALAGAALRYGGSVAALVFISRSPVVFFAVQLAAAMAEAIVCRALLALSMPRAAGAATPGWALLRNEFRFAAGMIVGSAMATMINQADKLALSHALPLRQFGVFGLVVSISMGIAMVVPPFVQVFQPRLTTLLAQGRRGEFIHVYRLSAALIQAVAVGLAGAVAAQPALVIYAWTGQRALAVELAPTLTLYAAGSGVAAFLFVPFLLQYAQGRVRLHVIGNVAFGAVWIPAAVYAAFAWGTIGTGAVWLGGNLAYLLLWVPVIHASLLTPEERRGILTGVWTRALGIGVMLAATRLIPMQGLGRPAALAVLAAASLVAATLCALASSELRSFVAGLLTGRRESAA
jgi:O-antigen/teichoic acid export membrane protein